MQQTGQIVPNQHEKNHHQEIVEKKPRGAGRGIVSAPDSLNPFSVEHMVQNKKSERPHADPLVRCFTDQALGPQKQQRGAHRGIDKEPAFQTRFHGIILYLRLRNCPQAARRNLCPSRRRSQSRAANRPARLQVVPFSL